MLDRGHGHRVKLAMTLTYEGPSLAEVNLPNQSLLGSMSSFFGRSISGLLKFPGGKLSLSLTSGAEGTDYLY